MHFTSHRYCVAPMLDWTDRHARYFLRLISSEARLYTEMVTTGAILFGKQQQRHLDFSIEEKPLALQLGGSDPRALAQVCALVENYAYDEINLNVGCPSDRVQSGKFGACLMADPKLVAECVSAMQNSSDKLISVKCRIGIDKIDSLEFLHTFISTIAQTSCSTFIIHARNAWLSGLSPKENREVPPLNYARVYEIKKLFPHLNIIINGGITNMSDTIQHLKHTDGVMIGREAYNNPYSLIDVDGTLFSSNKIAQTRFEIVQNMLPYIETQLSQGAKLNHITRHMLGIFNGVIGAKAYRRYLSQHAYQKNAGIEVILAALALVDVNSQIFNEDKKIHEQT